MEQGSAFDEQLHRLAAEDREDRLANGRRLVGTERPGADGWGSMPRVSASLTVWAMPPGTCSSITAWQVSQSRPLTALQEAGHCALVVASAVGLQGGPRILEEGVRAGHREQRRLQQGEGVHDLRTVERQLQDDRPTVGVADDVRAPDTQVVEQATGVRGVVGDAHRRRGVGAPGPTPPVVSDQLMAVGERRLGETAGSPAARGAAQRRRFARSHDLVFQLDPVDLCAVRQVLLAIAPLARGWCPHQRREEDCYGGNAVTLGTHGPGSDTAPRIRRGAMRDGADRGLVERAHDAAARNDWRQAFDLFMEADAGGLLDPDLPVLGEVAYAAGHVDVTIEAWERAHAGWMQAGDRVAAAAAAVRVAMHLLFDTALMAPVRGWWHERSGFWKVGVRRRRTRGSRSSAPTSGC